MFCTTCINLTLHTQTHAHGHESLTSQTFVFCVLKCNYTLHNNWAVVDLNNKITILSCVCVWLARADCFNLINSSCIWTFKKRRKKRKNIGLCRVSIHVVFVKWDDIQKEFGKKYSGYRVILWDGQIYLWGDGER